MTRHRSTPSAESPGEPYDAKRLTRLRRNLRNWYRRRARDLPWRRRGDPYGIWISEIMLQQTTVAAVVPYFERFVRRFPDVSALAAAEPDDVLHLWEGLGYYSRARNIHRAARCIVTQSGGEFPQTVEELMALPGIGRYTAGAIVSFAYDRKAPIVEANTLRLYARLLGFDGDPRSAAGQRRLWAFAEAIVPARSPGEFNQALMELGSQVCTPSEPDCGSCPLRTGCRALADGRQSEIPAVARRSQITPVVEFAVAIACRGRYLLRRCPEGQRWAGLWDFVRFPLDDAERLIPGVGLKPQQPVPPDLQRAVCRKIADDWGLDVADLRFLGEIRHSVTRYRIRLQCLHAETAALPPPNESLQAAEPCSFQEFPLSVTGRRMAEQVAALASNRD